ncbi:MAG: hypothetical protein EBR82_35165 [Caulobacteraceae bacterium]|nr:hypothetical protein [Caulobacteraceae bacterium]
MAPSTFPDTPPRDFLQTLGFIPTPHAGWPLPDAEEMRRHVSERPRDFAEFLREREERIRRSVADPLRHGYEPEIWHVVDDLLCAGKKVVLIDPSDHAPKEIVCGSEVYISGANRSSKSEYCGRTVVKTLVQRPRVRAWCFHASGPRSVQQQQPRVWKFIPPEWKKLSKHPIAYIKYKPANGFTGEPPTFVGPNESQCWFLNYSMDVKSLEGDEIDIAWMTELMPHEFVTAVRFRLAQRAGKLILDFTPADGYTPTVALLTHNAERVVQVPAPLLPTQDGYELVPRVSRADQRTNPGLSIVYFHLSDNPFANAKAVIEKAKAGGRKMILERVYGVAEKLVGNQFPTFKREVHVITEAQWRALGSERAAKHYVDPCSGRNWANIWVAATPAKQLIIYREWPCPSVPIRGVGLPGYWAEMDASKPDGRRGDAQKPFGFGLDRYFEEILLAEGWTEEEIEKARALQSCRVRPLRKGQEPVDWVYERMMDSRFGAAPTLARGETITLIETMADLGMDFEATPGEHQQEGIEAVQDLLYYDEDRPIGLDNRPTLLVHERCENTIWALSNWTGADGKHGACKDFIDLARYMALSPPEYFTEAELRPRGGGAY